MAMKSIFVMATSIRKSWSDFLKFGHHITDKTWN